MITAGVGASECSSVRLIDAGFEALRNQDEANLVINFLIGRMLCNGCKNVTNLFGCESDRKFRTNEDFGSL